MSILFAATYPERVRSLVLYGSFARLMQAADYPWGWTVELADAIVSGARAGWGDLGGSLSLWAPSVATNPSACTWWNRFITHSASPASFETLYQMIFEIDLRNVLPTIKVPTLVIHRADDAVINVGNGRYLADHILAAKYLEHPGQDHLWFWGDADEILRDIRGFLTGVRSLPESDRVLATVLFTDIVTSTERAAQVGDRRWKDLLDQHDALIRRELERHRGRLVKNTGDGILATFDGPARAIRCAQAIATSVKALGIEVRAGLHTGEVELRGEDVTGMGVNIAARVMDAAGPGEVVLSSTVKDRVAGSGLRFSDRGNHDLRGVPGEWRLFAVEG